MRTPALIVVALSGAALAACTLLDPLSGLDDGGLPDGRPLDAGYDTSVADASGDAGPATDAEAGLPVDAGSPHDASDGGCGHTFCENFDEDGAATFSEWTQVITVGGTLALTSDSVSPPHALQATCDVGQGQGPTLLEALPSGGTLHMEVDMKGDCAILEADAVTISLVPAPPGYQSASLVVYQSPSSVHLAINDTLEDGGGVDAADQSLGGSFADWRHFAIDVDLTAQTFEVTTTSEAGTTSNGVPIQPALPSASGTTLQIGINFHSETSAQCSVYFDNVVVDVQ